jgi:hypothetical protein
MLILTSLFTYHISIADASCPWIDTYERQIADVIKSVEQKSGKTPSVSCGAGTDYKVCHSCADRLSEKDWDSIRNMMAEPSFRKWHSGWHAETNGQPAPAGLDNDTFQGENFLYFHRELIRSVMANLAARGLPCLRIPTQIPEKANDPIWPNRSYLNAAQNKKVCDAQPKEILGNISQFESKFETAIAPILEKFRVERKKIEETLTGSAQMDAEDKLWQQRKKDEDEIRKRILGELGLTEKLVEILRSCPTEAALASFDKQQKRTAEAIKETVSPSNLTKNSLGAIGSEIDGGWHGGLHSKYATIPPRRTDCSRGEDHPLCEDLGGLSSTMVNQHFYLIHGVVDSTIDHWLKLNGYEVAAKDCRGIPKCYQWKGTYAGAPPDFLKGSGCDLKHGAQPVTENRDSVVR